MEAAPPLSRSAIEGWISEPSLSRGLTYAHQNAIFDPRRSGLTISARCYGSSAPYYRVSATLSANGTVRDADCTCPIGDGGFCKHVAALLFTYQAQPQAFRVVEDLVVRLERLDKPDLIALIKRMLAAEPELEDLLEAPVTATEASPVDTDLIRRQVANAARNAGHEWGAIDDFAANLRPILELADRHLRRDAIVQAALIFAVLPLAALEHYDQFDDQSGGLHEVVDECVHGLSECLAATEAPEQRRPMLEALFAIRRWDLDFGGIDMGADAEEIIAEQATPAELQLVAGWITQALEAAAGDYYGSWKRETLGRWLSSVLARSGHPLDAEASLRLARASDQPELAVRILLEHGRLADALSEAQQAPDHRLPQVADLLWEAGHQDNAFTLMERRAQPGAHYYVYGWLDTHLEQLPDKARALKLAQALFSRAPTVERYKRLVRLAEQAGRWPDMRSEALARLQRPAQEDLLAQIHLAEGAIEDAVEVAGAIATSQTPNTTTLLDIAQAAEKTLPSDAAWLYTRVAELLIARQNRGSYAEAAQVIRRLRDLHRRQGHAAEAQASVAHFRTEYKRFRALQDELSRAGL